MASSQTLSVGDQSLDALKTKLQTMKKEQEQQIAALEERKEELLAAEADNHEEESEDDARRMRAGHELLRALDERIKSLKIEMQEKKRSQELRKQQLMDEREQLIRQISAEVEELKATQAAAGQRRSGAAASSSTASAWLTTGVGLSLLVAGACYVAMSSAEGLVSLKQRFLLAA